MISREELEKLIESGETIWNIERLNYNKINVINLNENYRVVFDNIYKEDTLQYKFEDIGWCGCYSLKDLYKTKNDAECEIKTTLVRGD